MTITLAIFFTAHYAMLVHFIDAVIELTQEDYANETHTK